MTSAKTSTEDVGQVRAMIGAAELRARHVYQTFDEGEFEVELQPLVIRELQSQVRYLSEKLDTIRRQSVARSARYRARRKG